MSALIPVPDVPGSRKRQPSRSTAWKRLTGTLLATALLVGAPMEATLASPAVKTLEANGTRFEFVEQGSGPLVLMLHGALSDHRSWLPQMDLLADEFHVVSVTQRYFGKNGFAKPGPDLTEELQAQDIAEFIKALGKGPAHLVGLSMGGRNAHLATLRYPERVRSAYLYEGLVPIDAKPSNPEGAKQWVANFQKAWGPLHEDVKKQAFIDAGRKLISNVSGDPGYYDRAPAALQEIWRDNSPTLARYLPRKQVKPMTCEELSRNSVPLVAVAGTRSELAPGAPIPPMVARYEGCLGPAGTSLLIQDATHQWPRNHPEAFVASVRAFIRQH